MVPGIGGKTFVVQVRLLWCVTVGGLEQAKCGDSAVL